jgi:ABC-type nitrate/sulfonate/bicarbonate transport system substrate-binding protein
VRLVILIAFIAILVSLGLALGFIAHTRSTSSRTVRALTIRITLSVALFIFLLVAWALGWIAPHGLGQ